MKLASRKEDSSLLFMFSLFLPGRVGHSKSPGARALECRAPRDPRVNSDTAFSSRLTLLLGHQNAAGLRDRGACCLETFKVRWRFNGSCIESPNQ